MNMPNTSARFRVIALAVIVSLLASSCSQLAPTARPMPLTDTPILPTTTDAPLPPTATIVAPTDTPVPTNTPAPPTTTPTEIAPEPNATASIGASLFSHDQLVEDTRQLARIIENTHPDPYINGGGRIAFHRRLQRILNAIPEQGMTKMEYLQLVRPLVASIGDGHTRILDNYEVNGARPGGVPLRFDIVEKSLYVSGAPEEYEDLIGSLLVSIEGVPFAELCARQPQLRGTENEYRVLQFLADESLWYRQHMEDLLSEWKDTSHVTVELARPTGEIEEVVFDLPIDTWTLTTPPSQVTLPTRNNTGFFYDFLDTEGQIAYLRANHMTDYREAAENNQLDEARSARLPSTTQTFRDMVVDMEEAGTETLLIDLRYNEGGHVIMADILLYFLYGKDALMTARFRAQATGGGWVERYSELYFENITSVTIDDINAVRIAVPLVVGDYDFTWDYTGDVERFQLSEIVAAQEKWYEKSPTFYAEYESGAYEAYYRPEKVVILIDTHTFSSGSALARYLYNAGAILVGTPSSQATNCFGRNELQWQLEHTRIQGKISIGYTVRYPDDPEVGRVLPVHYPLTYEKLAAYDFDPNAAYLYALELLPELGETSAVPPAVITGQEPTPVATAIAPGPGDTLTEPGHYSRDRLIEDARQLAYIIESTHPDPYIRGGGKIAFHRRLQHLLNSIPEGGMTRDEFIRLLRPFVAAVGDSHTEIWTNYQVDDRRPGGVPLRFDIVEESLYVAGVPTDEQRDLLGAVLVSVEGVPLARLLERQKSLAALENEYHVLEELASHTLWYGPIMQDLLPEWQDTSRVSVELQLPTGESEEHTFSLPQSMSNLSTPRSQVRLPATDRSGFLYDFLDAEREIAYLRVDHMTFYREDSEVSVVVGVSDLAEATLNLIPSVTETFRDMVIDMEEAGTETLIIDLRNNGGGDSLMSDILVYFLYGKETLKAILAHAAAAGGGEGSRYSSFYFASRPKVTLESINEDRTVPLIEGDYDFTWDFTDDEEKFQVVQQSDEALAEWWYQMTSTFYAEYESQAYEGHYRPQNILVLVTPRTFSSGFTLARYLYLAGATLVGTPSAQASNCFGNAINWRLDHTGIEGIVSFKYYVEFPDDPEMGRVLPVHYPLTYEKLASLDFDPNAEYLYALELLQELGE